MFPLDRYTPHGYLDNPAHAWKIGPGGVLRSRPAIGMGWHYPSFVGAYNYTFIYQLNLQLGFKLPNNRRLLEAEDFQRAGIDLYIDYHSKNLLRYVFLTPENVRVSTSFFLADNSGDVLAGLTHFENFGTASTSLNFSLYFEYERDLSKGLTWGSELYALHREAVPNQGYVSLTPGVATFSDKIDYPHFGTTLGVFQEGTTFHLMQAQLLDQTNQLSSSAGKAPYRDGKRLSLMYSDQPNSHAHLLEIISRPVELKAGQSLEFLQVIGRGETEIQAIRKVQPFFVNRAEAAKTALAQHRVSDAAFWENAPKLGGDWPDYIRRGPIYDLETLRTLVRPPTARYAHYWDAMQIQVPRVVLAEAALDMLILSYADPEAAKAVLYGTFADAPEPNVPCSREDGSYNMVAVDGSPCGTAPEWCFPFHCINLVYQRTGDKEWLAKLYPLLENFVDFWLTYRYDAQNRPFYKSSWEAGQDNSPRFGIKDDPSGGGALVSHIWPADLQAAMYQSCALLAKWAAELGRDSTRWQAETERQADLMQQLWRDKWFYDFDTNLNAFSEVLDTMQLAPLLCGAATPEQIANLYPKLADPPKHGQIFPPLMWPSIAFCLIEACSEAGRLDLAARHSWPAIVGVYRWLDSNPATIDKDAGGLPGTGREYWPQTGTPKAEPPNGGGGAEVYGWGCLTTLLLYRYIIGFREEDSPPDTLNFSLRPDLPAELLIPGKTYTAGPFQHCKAEISLVYRVTETANQLQIGVSISTSRSGRLSVLDQNEQILQESNLVSTSHQMIMSSENGKNLQFKIVFQS